MKPVEYYIPSDVPDCIKSFNSDVKQLAVGQPGKNGMLLLIFKNDHGKTVLEKSSSEVPLSVQRALYCDDACLNLAYVYIVSVSGGLLQGDRYRMDITMKKDSMAHITTQGATRIYSMDSNSAMQMVNVCLDENSYLELIPDQIIPYRNSRFYQTVNLNIHDTATMVYSDIITPGRVAMGESFEYDVCFLKTAALNQDNVLKFMDVSNIEPKKQKLSSFGVLGKNTVYGSIYVITKKQSVVELYSIIGVVISKNADVSGGISIMNDDSGLVIRILGCETDAVKRVVSEIVSSVRQTCIGVPFSELRKN